MLNFTLSLVRVAVLVNDSKRVFINLKACKFSLLLLFEEHCGFKYGGRCLFNPQGHCVSLGVMKMGQTIPRLAKHWSLELEVTQKRGIQAEDGRVIA